MTTFTFEIPYGKMTIYAEKFFPCTKTNLKKLIKIGGYDPELIENVKSYLLRAIEDTPSPDLRHKYRELLVTLDNTIGGRK
jgi:hypothetical protein